MAKGDKRPWWRRGKKRGGDGSQHPPSWGKGGVHSATDGGIVAGKQSDRTNGHRNTGKGKGT